MGERAPGLAQAGVAAVGLGLPALPLAWGRQPAAVMVGLGLLLGGAALFVPIGLLGRRPIPAGQSGSFMDPAGRAIEILTRPYL